MARARIGMKHSGRCVRQPLHHESLLPVAPHGVGDEARGSGAALEAVKSPADSASLPFILRAQLASAAAWSPNPKNPPLYLDLPVGDQQQEVLAKWTANSPLAFLDQYAWALRRYNAIALDVGDQDGLKTDTGKLHDAMDAYGIKSAALKFTPGTHTSTMLRSASRILSCRSSAKISRSTDCL